MGFKEVKELRKNENFAEALKMALSDLEKNPNDIWYKRSIAWVYYELAKKKEKVELAHPELTGKNTQAGDFDSFIDCIRKINELNLPENEKMIFDNLAYQIGIFLFSLSKEEKPDIKKVSILFEEVQKFFLTKPAESYTFLFKSFHKYNKTWQNYKVFADWWGFENFRFEDFLQEEFNGKKIMPIVEQAYIAYARKLLEGEVGLSSTFSSPKVIDKIKISIFLTSIEILIKEHPEYQYLHYYKAKLLLAVGDKENILSAFIPFAKKKKNEFWTWELMSDVFPKSDERKIACLCKALSLNTPEVFIINTRQKLAELLIEQEKYNEAKTEIVKIIDVKEKNDWKIQNKISNLTAKDWYKNATAFDNNKKFYKLHLKEAEQILFSDIPEQIVAVEFVNTDKKILNFVADKQTHGFFKYGGLLNNPKIGDILKVRFEQKQGDHFYRVLTVEKADNTATCMAISDFSGKININIKSSFGFADNVYIDKKLIAENKIENNQLISGKAILSFNKKKNEWGRKALNINLA